MKKLTGGYHIFSQLNVRLARDQIPGRMVMDEIVSISDVIRNSDLNWTIIRLPMLTDKALKNKATADYLGTGKVNLFWLNRNDLADFIIEQLADDTFVKKAPVLSN